MKKFISILSIFALTLLFSSCDDTDYSCTAPTFAGLTLSPNNCYPGDEVNVTLNIKNKGKNSYIYETILTVYNHGNAISSKKLKLDKSEFNLNYNTCKIVAPSSPGEYTIGITSKISYTAGSILYPTNQPQEQKATLLVEEVEN